MRVARTTALTSALAIAALVAAGTASAAVASPAAHQRPALVVRVAGKHKVHAPRHTNPGLVRVRNTGKRPVLILDPLKSAGVATLVKEMNAANADPGHLEFTRDFAVVDILLPHTSAYLHLKPGVHYLLDAGANTYTAADVTTTRVKGAKRNAVAPKSTAVNVKHDGTLTAVPKRQLDKNASIRVLNKANHLEEVFLAPIGKDVSDAKVQAFLAHPSFEGLFKVDTAFDLKVLGLTSPHRSYVAQLHAKAGRHLLVALPLTDDSGMLTMRPGQARLLNLK